MVFLGTSSGTPTVRRNVSSMVLHLKNGEQWIFDCGEATQHRLKQSSHVTLGNINRIFITHLHGDHTFGLPGVIASLLISNPQHPPITVYGPKGINELVYTTLDRTYTQYPRDKLKVVEFFPYVLSERMASTFERRILGPEGHSVMYVIIIVAIHKFLNFEKI